MTDDGFGMGIADVILFGNYSARHKGTEHQRHKVGKNNETTLLRSAMCLCAFATLCLSSYSMF